MIRNNPTLGLVNMNAYIKVGEILSICYQDIERKLNSNVNQKAITLLQICNKMMRNNPYIHVDLVNMNAYIKFGEILSICSHIEQKRNTDISEGPQLYYKCAKNDV